MRALVAQQEALAAARDTEVVHIIEMIVYSDRAGGVIDTRFRFSTVALTGFTDAEDGVTSECITYLRGVPKVPEHSMFHFPSERELTDSSLRSTLAFELTNSLWSDGTRLSAFLESKNVEFSDVKYMRLYLPLGTMNAHKNTPIDLTGIETGSETVFFRGVVDTPTYGEEVLSFSAASKVIESQALVISDPSFLISAVGQRVPQPYGPNVIVRGVRVKEPAGAVLTQRINNATATGLFNVDTDQFLPTSGTYFVAIDQETGVECVGIAASNRISIVARGTNPSSHDVGTPCILEGTDATIDPTWIIAEFEIKSVTAVLLGTSLDDAVALEPADFTLNNPDTTTFPGESIATISMDTNDLLAKFPDSPLSVLMFVQLDGRIVPFEFESRYDFDDDTNWNDDPAGVHESVSTGGVHYQKVETPYDENAVNTDTSAGWNTQNCQVTFAANPRLQGIGSVKATRDTAGSQIYGIDRTVSLPFPNNTSPGPLFIVNVRLSHPGGIGDVTSVAVQIGNSPSTTDVFGFDDSLFANNVWKTIVCERGRRTSSTGGGMTGATITFVKVFVSNGQQGHSFFLDKIQTVDTQDMTAQKNDLANIDMDSDGDLYQMFAKARRPTWIDALTLSISNETLTGTTAHTDFHEVELTGLTTVWQQYRETATTGGTPDATFIESIRFDVTLLGTDVYQGVFSHTGQNWAAGANIDSLSIAIDPGTPYIGGLVPGDSIEHPANIIRIHMSENGGLTDAEIDFDGLQDLFDSIGGGRRWAFDMRAAGLTFDEILLRLCWEAGANVARVDLTTGQLWRILIGLSSVANYGFGPDVITIEEDDYRVMRILPKDRTTVWTDFEMLYKLQSALDVVDDKAFEGVLLASVRQNDISAFVNTDAFTAAEERYGRRIKSGPIFSMAIHDDNTAQERLGREVVYRMDPRPLVTANLESWVAAKAELGDIVTFNDRLNEVERKMRILTISQSTIGAPTTMIEVD